MYNCSSQRLSRGHVILERGQEVRVQLDMPQDQMDILDVRSELSLIHNSVQRKHVPTRPGSREGRYCTGPYAARVTGLELCGHVELPWSPEAVTLYGPAALSMTLHKRDTHTGYSFIAKHVKKTQSIATLLEIKTPGSKVDRNLGFDLLGDMTDLKDVRVHLGFSSPWKSAKVTGSFTNTAVLKSATCRMIVDKAVLYAVTAEVKVMRDKFDVIYFPVLEIRRPGSSDWLVKGMVSVRAHWKVLAADVLAQGFTHYPLILKTSITNTNLEKSIKLTAVHGAGVTYTFAAGTSLAFIGKGASGVDVSYFLVFTTPTRELLTLSGNGGYRPGHIFKTDLKLTIDKYKPLLAECVMTKMKRRSDVLLYGLDVSIKSAVALLKVDSVVDVKKDRMVSARVTVTHDIPSILPRDKMTVGFKATVNSNFVSKSCYITLNMDSLAIPDYSFSAKLLGEHRTKQTEAEMVVKHGQDRRDPNNQILFSTKVKHDVIDSTVANVGYKVLVSLPRKDIDFHLKGRHIHTTRSVDSACDLTFGTNQSAHAHLMFKDRSNRLLKMTGEVQIQAPVLDVVMETSVVQKNPKHFVHSVSLREGQERRHSIMTVFRESDKQSFAILSDILIHGWQNIRLTGDTRLELADLKVGSSIFFGENKYGANVASAVKANKHKLMASLYYPRELYSLMTNTEQRFDGIYSSTVKVAWEDEKRVQRPLLAVRGLLHRNHKAGGDIRKLKLSAQSPAMRGFMTVDNEKPQLLVRGNIFRGRKKSSYSTTLELKKPVSLENVQFLCKILTPDRHCHRTEVEVVHTMHPKVAELLEHLVERGFSRLTRGWLPPPKETSLSVSLQGGSGQTVNQHTAEGVHTQQWWTYVHEQDTVPTGRADIQGGITVKSTIENHIDVRLNFMHKQYGHLHEQTFKLDGRSNNDTIAFVFNNNLHHFHIRSVGELDLKTQAGVVLTEWNLETIGGSILSNFSSSWCPGGKVHFEIRGHRDINRHNELIGNIIFQTPWRDLAISLVHAQSSESFLSECSLRQSDVEIVSHRIYALFMPSLIDANLTVLTPWTSKVVGALHGRYNATALTGAVEVRWTPRDRIAADGQVTLVAWNDVSVFLSVDTPFPGARVVVYEISNKNTRHGLSSFMTLRFGFGKTYGIETLLRKDPVNIRVKLQSPYENFRVLETGVQMTGSVMKMKTDADFRLYPLIGKCECLLEWECASVPNISGKLRISTPLKMLPATEISMRLKYVDDMHISRLAVQFLPSPPFTVDAVLSLSLPFLVSVEAKTPVTGFRIFNTTIKHQVSHSLTATYLQMYYPPYQMFETRAVVDWNDTANRGALIRNDLKRFEDVNLLFWNKGSLQEFAARGKLVLPENLTSFFSRLSGKLTSTDIKQMNKTLQFLGHVTSGQIPALEADVSCIVSQKLTELTWKILFKNPENADSAAVLLSNDLHATSLFLVSLRPGLEFLGSTNVTVSEGVLLFSHSLTAHLGDNVFNESLVLSRDENVTSWVG
ncbi:uncharacterized protein LOC112557668 [Pomacea canaliculata]|uniref:uncharacterized protein LOC112557668 n=1 Tax=Pomacea canaliculata TaxID=400727 RepID=UPI000D73B0E5|nr:uncharacterized protein LOC112557668 [Pomacea canaliculata]